MAQNLVICGVTYNGVESMEMTNTAGQKITYIEKTNVGTGVPVAQIGERRFYTVEDALAAAVSGDTVKLTASSVENAMLIIPSGVTIDLNGNTLESHGVVGFTGSNVIDGSSGNTGLLKTAMDAVILSTNNTQLPVWNGEGYIFVTVNFAMNLDSNYTGEGFKIMTLVGPEMPAVALFKNGAADNNVQIGIRLTWNTANGTSSQDLMFNDETVATIFSSNTGTVTGYGQRFTMTVTGLAGVENLQARTFVKSGTNTEIVRAKALQLT